MFERRAKRPLFERTFVVVVDRLALLGNADLVRLRPADHKHIHTRIALSEFSREGNVCAPDHTLVEEHQVDNIEMGGKGGRRFPKHHDPAPIGLQAVEDMAYCRVGRYGKNV